MVRLADLSGIVYIAEKTEFRVRQILVLILIINYALSIDISSNIVLKC